jgi:hypothetical protein
MVCTIVVLTFTAAGQQPDTTVWADVPSEEEAEALPATSVFEPVTAADQQLAPAREVDRHKAAAIKKDENFWYADEAPKRTPPPPVKPTQSSPSAFAGTWFRDLVWFVLVGGFILILFLFLRSGNVRLFEKKPKVPFSDADVQPGEDLFAVDYQSRVQQAIAAGEYRYATRFLYLGLLKEMALKNLIRYGHERTNRDYLEQLWGTDYYHDFFGLTRSFEYTWYGKFNLSEDDFQLVERNFISFKQRVHA